MNAQSLSELLKAHRDALPRCPFPALLDARPLTVTAILERTAVVATGEFERHVVNLHRLSVNAALLEWCKDTGTRRTDNGQPGSPQAYFTSRSPHRLRSGERLVKRQGSDSRALREQGKGRCPRCPEGQNVHPLSNLNSNRYCKACVRQYHRERRASLKREQAVA